MRKKIVKELMTPIIAVADGSSVQKAALEMSSKKTGAVLVREEGELTGIFTKADLILKIIEKKLDADGMKVSEVMSKPLIAIDGDLSKEEAVNFMQTKRIRHLAVKDKGKIIGMLSINELSA